MNDKELNLDALENADEDTIRKIAADCPASDEEKERMFAMSRKIYNERTKESEYKNDMEVSGVDVYRKPAWHKFAAAAAALVIGAGAIAGGVMLKKNNNSKPPVVDSMTDRVMCPIGDLSLCSVRISTAAIAPAVFQPSEYERQKITTALTIGQWEEISLDTPLPDGEYVTLYFRNHMLAAQLEEAINEALKAEDGTSDLVTPDNAEQEKVFTLKLFNDNTVLYEDESTQTRYQLDDDTANTVREASKFDPLADYDLLYPEVPYDDLMHTVWDIVIETDEKNTIDLFFPVTNETIKVAPENCRFCLGQWDQDDSMNCVTDPEVVKKFNLINWKEATREANVSSDGILVSFRCTDENALRNYQYTIHSSGLAVVSYDDVEFSKKQNMIYDIGSDAASELHSAFYDMRDKALTGLAPDELFSLMKLRSAKISRNNDPSTQTALDDEDLKLLNNAILSATWEKLPDDTLCNNRIYNLTLSTYLRVYNMDIYPGSIATFPGAGVFRVSDGFMDALTSISDSVWEKVEPQDDPAIPADENAELIERATKLYNECIPRYNEFVGGPPRMLSVNLSEDDFYDFGDNLAGYLLPGVSSIEDIRRMFFKEFSERYHANDIGGDSPYFEREGKVYWKPSNRGSNIYFQRSEITEVQRITDDEIVFNVKNYYDGNGVGDPRVWAEQVEFSVVVQPDGSWLVGKLTIPD